MVERTAVFIDGGYLDALRNYGFRGRIDLQKLVSHAVGDGRLLRAYYYTCMPYQSATPTDEEKLRFSGKDHFLSKIRRFPRFEVRLGKLQKTADGVFQQKKVDILLAIEVVSLAWKGHIDKAVIIAGDSDFVPAIQQAKDAGVVVSLYYVKNACNTELLDSVDERCEITQELFNCLCLEEKKE